jgi:hypothetical protein
MREGHPRFYEEFVLMVLHNATECVCMQIKRWNSNKFCLLGGGANVRQEFNY